MKATLEFNLPDEKMEYERCNDAPKLGSVLWEFEQAMRTLEKYQGNRPITPGEVRDLLCRIMADRDINFDKTYFS